MLLLPLFFFFFFFFRNKIDKIFLSYLSQ